MGHDLRAIIGSIIGMLTFAVGIALLILSFALAYGFFNQLGNERVALFQNLPKGMETLAGSILSWVLRSLFRMACLFAMGFIASLIAARGAHIYGASRAAKSHGTQSPENSD